MQATNVEFVTELMEFSAYGGLIQAFVLQALEQYCARVAAASPEEVDTPMVSGHAWHGCAVEIQQKLERHLGKAAVRSGNPPSGRL